MDSDLAEHMIPYQVPRLAEYVMGIRRSHATDVLVYFHSNPVMPTTSCRKAACHTDMEDIKDDTTAQDSTSLHKLIQIVVKSSERGRGTN